jgi:hypothetical protein
MESWSAMIRLRAFLVTALLVFVSGYFAASIVLRTEGPHTWFRAQAGLKSATMSLEEYHSLKGEYPDEETVNGWVDWVWSERNEIPAQFEDAEFDLSELHCYLARGPLANWNQPVYVVSDDIPGGRGFYSPGDDGVSASNGNDADDINSWSSHSNVYYGTKSWRMKRWQYASVGFGCSVLVTLLLVAFSVGEKNGHLEDSPGSNY